MRATLVDVRKEVAATKAREKQAMAAGNLTDGTEFDSSYSRNKPVTFRVDRVVPGWREALPLMKEGAKWQLFIPTAVRLSVCLAGCHPL